MGFFLCVCGFLLLLLFYSEVEQVSQKSCGCPIIGGTQRGVGRDFEQPGLVEGVLAHGRGVGMRWSLKGLRTILGFLSCLLSLPFTAGVANLSLYFGKVTFQVWYIWSKPQSQERKVGMVVVEFFVYSVVPSEQTANFHLNIVVSF